MLAWLMTMRGIRSNFGKLMFNVRTYLDELFNRNWRAWILEILDDHLVEAAYELYRSKPTIEEIDEAVQELREAYERNTVIFLLSTFGMVLGPFISFYNPIIGAMITLPGAVGMVGCHILRLRRNSAMNTVQEARLIEWTATLREQRTETWAERDAANRERDRVLHIVRRAVWHEHHMAGQYHNELDREDLNHNQGINVHNLRTHHAKRAVRLLIDSSLVETDGLERWASMIQSPAIQYVIPYMQADDRPQWLRDQQDALAS